MATLFDSHRERSAPKRIAQTEALKGSGQKPSQAKSAPQSVPFEVDSLGIIKNILKNEPSYPEIGLRQFSEWYNSRTREAIVMYVDSLHLKSKVTIQTFFLAIAYIDTILSTYEQKPSQLTVELIAASCFILAMKTNETDFYFSFTEDLFPSFDRKYNLKAEDLFNMEIQCILKLKYELNVLTAFEMMSILLDTSLSYGDDARKGKSFKKEFASLCHSIAHKASYKGCIMLKYSPVQIGFAIVYIARLTKGLDNNVFNRACEAHLDYSIRDYDHCVNNISSLIEALIAKEKEEKKPQSKAASKPSKVAPVLRTNNHLVAPKETTKTIQAKANSVKKVFLQQPQGRDKESHVKDFHSDTNLFHVTKRRGASSSCALPDIRQHLTTSIDSLNLSANASPHLLTDSNKKAVIKQKKQKYSLFAPLMV